MRGRQLHKKALNPPTTKVPAAAPRANRCPPKRPKTFLGLCTPSLPLEMACAQPLGYDMNSRRTIRRRSRENRPSSFRSGKISVSRKAGTTSIARQKFLSETSYASQRPASELIWSVSPPDLTSCAPLLRHRSVQPIQGNNPDNYRTSSTIANFLKSPPGANQNLWMIGAKPMIEIEAGAAKNQRTFFPPHGKRHREYQEARVTMNGCLRNFRRRKPSQV